MTCKDCIHFDVCHIIETYGAEDINICNHFKNKANFVELPCKVGDIVYVHDNCIWYDDCCHCEHFQIGGFGDPHECARTKSPFKHPDCTEISERTATGKDIYLWLAYDDFGKTVFLTKEEAEQKLKGGADNGNRM